MRFFAPYPTLSARDVDRFVNVDYLDRVAFVVTVADEIIAVGRYDKLEDAEAEVAFLVEDRHQGRGLAQLLLEHLAQAGRERGFTKFIAEVLPDNARMIQTFRDFGYHVEGGYQDGVLRLVFPIEATDTSVGVMRSREHRAEARSMERFFEAESVAIIGASRRQDTIGSSLVRNLVLGGYSGRVYAVNPAADAVAGMPAYKNVKDVPDRVDLAVVAVPADAVHEVVLDCAAKGVHGLVVVSSGFAETGHEGRQRQRQLVGARPVVRAAAGRTELSRGDQHRLRRLAQRVAVAGDAATRTGRLLLPVRRAGGGDPGDGRTPRARPLDVRQCRQPRRRVGQRPAPVLAGGRRDRGRAALPGVDRQPAQVLPDRPPGRPGQARRRGEVRPGHPGCAGRARGPDDGGSAGCGRRDVPSGRGDPGGDARRDVRRGSAAGAPALAHGPAGRAWSGTPTPSGCWPPTRRRRRASWSSGRSR